MLTRRALLVSAVALVAGAALVTTATELAQAVAAGTSAALRRVLRVLEPQKGPWVNNNFWGDQFTGPFPATSGKEIAILPKNTIMYGPPHVHSVQLFRSDTAPAQNADIRARVTYGCGGVNNSFDCDWLHGAQFSLVCNKVDITAVSYTPTDQDPYTPSSKHFFLGALVAKGSLAQGAPLTYTTQRISIAAAGAHDFPVLDLVRRVTVLVGPNNNNDPAVPTGVTLDFQSAVGVSLVQYDAQVCAGSRMVPVPGGTTSVRIRCAATRDIALQWELGL